MKGTHHIIVSSKYLHYEFDLHRSLTILRGDSATGKTTLIEMVEQYVNNQGTMSITVSCDKPCAVLSGATWEGQLSVIKDSIVFLDEGNPFIKTHEFASAIQKTDNYYVIATREPIPSLPYSVEEVYGIRQSGKYGTLKKTYHEFYRLYDAIPRDEILPEVMMTEDSQAGFLFFQTLSVRKGIQCISACGKAKVYSCALQHQDRELFVIADGAAFGPEMDRILKLMKVRPNIHLYLPESFEWLLLSSDIVKTKELRAILENPGEFIESSEFFSWEQYFTDLLVRLTQGTIYQYAKANLPGAYQTTSIQNKVLRCIKVLSFPSETAKQSNETL